MEAEKRVKNIQWSSPCSCNNITEPRKLQPKQLKMKPSVVLYCVAPGNEERAVVRDLRG
jgi:hypothetical protein